MGVGLEGRNGIGHHPFARSAAPLSHAFWILAGGIAGRRAWMCQQKGLKAADGMDV